MLCRAYLLLLTFLLVLSAAQAEPHWSLRPRSNPKSPSFQDHDNHSWVRNDLDAFILERLRAKGLRPAPEADRATLIRRLSFDLTGLPPTPKEIAAFVADDAPDAYEKLVDRLLASPHYGERWAQHWLDVVRFAESDGFEYDRYRPGMWRYRDYVIQSLNDDKPYDRFVQEQLAGDELDSDNRDLQIAAGFHRLGAVRRNAGNAEVAFSRYEVLNEMTDAVGVVFLGMTVGCARCHDHKFDAFSQEDYYRLQAFLAATQEYNLPLADAKTQTEWQQKTKKIEGEIKRLRSEINKADGEAKDTLQKKLKEAERSLPKPLPSICTVRNVEAERMEIHVLKRGLPEKKGKRVDAGFPTALLSEANLDLPPEAKTKPRTALAKWLTSPDNPLTARVFVNRVWQYHFGRGLVETANDFGVNGSPPSHPELLDYLANEFVRNGLHLKPLHRLIVLSSTYRQASRSPEAKLGRDKDPDNRLLWQFPRRRLTAEEVRDAMLSAANRLNLMAGGESVIVPADDDLVKQLYDPSQWTVTSDEKEHDRRSIYLLAKRNLRLPFGQAFDEPDRQTSCPRRETSTHALQALEMLNGKTSNRLAEAFAQRLQHEAGTDTAKQVELAYLLTAGRVPTAAEKELSLAFLKEHPLREFALAIFNLNVFLYVN
jgi:Protein of unknown function (DUF1553)/Protein of unknown function (DUF1549)